MKMNSGSSADCCQELDWPHCLLYASSLLLPPLLYFFMLPFSLSLPPSFLLRHSCSLFKSIFQALLGWTPQLLFFCSLDPLSFYVHVKRLFSWGRCPPLPHIHTHTKAPGEVISLRLQLSEQHACVGGEFEEVPNKPPPAEEVESVFVPALWH